MTTPGGRYELTEIEVHGERMPAFANVAAINSVGVCSAEVEAAIHEHPAVHEAAHGVPHEQLPRNASGKILKTQLREQAVAE